MGKRFVLAWAKSKFIILPFMMAALFFSSCQSPPTPSPTTKLPVMPSATPAATAVTSNLPTEQPRDSSEILSRDTLECIPVNDLQRCADTVLGMEFESPATWGEIEGVLRTGWDSGYAYTYSFIDSQLPKEYLPEAAGLSLDFQEGRDWTPMDFAGFGDAPLQTHACEEQDLYPICEEISPNVRWMIRFPNARYFCERTHRNTSPIFRIEVNLPHHPRIHGLVFQVPFLSASLMEEIRTQIYPLFLEEPEMIPKYPEACSLGNRQLFDEQVLKFIQQLEARSLDAETLKNMDDLIHLAESITLDQ